MGLQVDYHAKPRCPLTLQIELSAGNMRMESPIKSLSILAKSVSYRQHAGTGSSRLGLFSRLSGPFCVSRLGWFC